MTKKVFISYQRQQESQIRELVTALEQTGHDVWYDQKLKSGQNWWEEILNHIESMDIIILALSQSYLKSQACEREWMYALGMNKTIIPLQMDETLQYESVPSDIRRLQISPYAGRAVQFQKLEAEMNAAPINAPPVRLPPRPAAPMDAPPPPKTSPFANRTLLLGGAVVLVVFVIVVALVLIQINKSPVTVGEIGPFDMTLIYGGEDSLTIKLNADSHLAGLTLESTGKTETITDHFTTLASDDFIGKEGTCLRYIREGTNPSIPLGCQNPLSVSLPESDIFWYSAGAYQPITLKQDGLIIGSRCEPADGFGRCNFPEKS